MPFVSNNVAIELLSNFDFKSSNSGSNFNLKNLIDDSWQQKNQIITAIKDYSSIGIMEGINEQKRVNLVIPLLNSTKSWIFPYLSKALISLKLLQPDKIILHLVVDASIVELWQEFVSIYSETMESLSSILVLGSVSDRSYSLNTDGDITKLILGLRVIIDPKVTFSDNSNETIDEYFKLNYNARYYENYDIYSESTLVIFENETEITNQLLKIANYNYNQIIFPVDIRTNSLQKYDVIWYLDGPEANFKLMVETHTQLNQNYSLNQVIVTNFDSQIKSENLNQSNKLYNLINQEISI